MNNIDKALKLKASYTEKRGLRMANGGAVSGAGTGTSDDIKANLSDGEYVLPADTVQAIGVRNLDEMRDATHTPVGTKDPMAYADGGLVEEDPLKTRAERLRNMSGVRAAIPPSTPWSFTGPMPGTPADEQAARLRTGPLPGAGLRETVTARGVPVPPPATPAPAAPAAPSGLRGALGTGARVLGGAGAALGGALAVRNSHDQSRALEGPNSGMDRAALAGENVGRFASTVAGASAGAGLGSSVPVVGTAIGGLAGGLAGYYAPEAVKKATDFVGLTDKSTTLPSVKADTIRAANTAGQLSQQQMIQQRGAPDTSTPVTNPRVSAFQQQYGAAAARAGERLGVDPNMLLAQWGMETGWGKHVIPGTNNLGNIKDFSGRGTGVRATDNMTGSVDRYAKFATPEEFADRYADLLERKYSGVKGAQDIGTFATGLLGGKNRYAEDPAYANKLARTYGMLSGRPQAAAQAAPQGVRGMGPDVELRDGGAPVTQRLLDDEKKRGDWVPVIRGSNVTEEWAENSGVDTMYAPGTTKAQARGRDAAFDNFAAPGREVDAKIQDLGVRRSQLAFDRQVNDQNKDADRAVKIETQNMARSKAGWDEFYKDADRANTVQGPKGPIVDAAAVQRQESAMKRGLATLGAESPADLSMENRERMKAAIELADKVNKISSNLNPFKPDPIASDDPTDLFGLERLANGDARMRNGQIIPKRVIDKVDSDFFMGTPTNKFNSLFKKDGAKNGVR